MIIILNSCNIISECALPLNEHSPESSLMKKPFLMTMASVVFFSMFSQMAFADSTQEKLEFAASLEETLGHFWAIEQNLDEGNAELALVHATHPIAELYDLMKPELAESDPELDMKVQETLMQLQNKANTKVSREQAQIALDDAREIIEIARSTVVGDELSNDTLFQSQLIKELLKTSISEYEEAVQNGVVLEMAEFQDGSAFVWESEQIFNSIKSDLDSNISDEIGAYYENLWAAYKNKEDPRQVKNHANNIIYKINEILEIEGEVDLLEYVENIRMLLEQTKAEYSDGNNDIALSLATKAYLDNYEFLETPLTDLGEEDLMEEVEVMLREELREMIRNGEPIPDVNSHVDNILEKMDTIAKVVPEFGTLAMIILAISIVSIVAITSKSKLGLSA